MSDGSGSKRRAWSAGSGMETFFLFPLPAIITYSSFRFFLLSSHLVIRICLGFRDSCFEFSPSGGTSSSPSPPIAGLTSRLLFARKSPIPPGVAGTSSFGALPRLRIRALQWHHSRSAAIWQTRQLPLIRHTRQETFLSPLSRLGLPLLTIRHLPPSGAPFSRYPRICR